MAEGLFRFRVKGAGERARDFDRAQRRIQDQAIASIRRLGRRGRIVLREHAPEDTGQLRDSIEEVPSFRAREPRVDLVTRGVRGTGGYDYTDVTRFGHRTDPIVAKRTQFLKVHIHGHRSPDNVIYARSVRGYHPATDWVEDAAPELKAAADAESRELGRRVAATVLH